MDKPVSQVAVEDPGGEVHGGVARKPDFETVARREEPVGISLELLVFLQAKGISQVGVEQARSEIRGEGKPPFDGETPRQANDDVILRWDGVTPLFREGLDPVFGFQKADVNEVTLVSYPEPHPDGVPAVLGESGLGNIESQQGVGQLLNRAAVIVAFYPGRPLQ